MTNTFQWSQVAVFRLKRQHLSSHAASYPVSVCQQVCGLQAQLMSAAELQLRARVPQLSRSEIGAALTEKRTLVKTSLMRQTLHVIAADDFAIYIAALKRSRMQALRRIMSRYGDITEKETAALTQAIVAALAEGPLTQPQLRELILPKVSSEMKRYIELAWSIQAFRPALVQGLICYGPDKNKKPTFVRVD